MQYRSSIGAYTSRALSARVCHSHLFRCICLLLIAISQGPRAASGADEDVLLERKIAALIRNFSGRLGIKQRVVATIVPANEHLASVESVERERDTYRIKFEASFLRTLDERDLNAAVAHEMGHVWIFTHFPFLQTESLANRQALKLVSRADLARVYDRVWKRKGERGDLSKVLDPVDGAVDARD